MARRAFSAGGGRLALVLGGGGVLGSAWTVGALVELQRHLGLSVADADLIVGTSSGSLLAAQLRLGVTVDELAARETEPAAPGSARDDLDRLLNARPPLRLPLSVGSPRILAAALARPTRMNPWCVLSALLPNGRATLAPVRRAVDEAVAAAPRSLVTESGWPAHRATWIVATDFDTGRRTVFGRGAEPSVPLADAVLASCSIPGFFRPVTIGGKRYVDGGVCSVASADLLTGAPVDRAVVVAPMAATRRDLKMRPMTALELVLRGPHTQRLARELREVDCEVLVLVPGARDLVAMGHNVLDAGRRRAVFESAIRTVSRRLDAVLGV